MHLVNIIVNGQILIKPWLGTLTNWIFEYKDVTKKFPWKSHVVSATCVFPRRKFHEV